MTTTPPRRRRHRWMAAILLLIVTLVLRGPGSAASPGDPLSSFGSNGVLRVGAPTGCRLCPGATSDVGTAQLATSGARTAFGYSYGVEEDGPEERSTVASAVALVQGGATSWRAPIDGPTVDADHILLAVGFDPATNGLVAVVTVVRHGDTDVPIGQEIRQYSAVGSLVSTISLPSASAGDWTTAVVAPDGSVVGVSEATTPDGLPLTTVRRYDVAGALRWTRTLPAGDSVESADVAVGGQVVLAGTRAVAAELSFEGLVVALTSNGAPDPGFGASGLFVSPAPDGFGRAFTAVDVEGTEVAVAGLDQWQGDDEDDDSPPGAALIVRLRNGQLWTAFTGDGVAEQRWAGTDGMRVVLSDVLVDGDRTVVAGRSTAFDSARDAATMIRYLPSGAVDPSFAIDPAAAEELIGLAPVAGGYLSAAPPNTQGGTWAFPLQAFAQAGTTSAGPPAPTNVRVTAAGAKTATIAWSAPPPPVTGYEIEVDVGADGSADLVSPSGNIVSTPYGGLPSDRLLAFALRARNGQGLGPRSAWSPPAVPPFRSVDAFIDRQLRDFAGRAPTGTELAAWRAALAGGDRPSTQISRAIDLSTWDPVRGPIIRLYRAYFLRLPDASGLDYWVNRSRTGSSLSSISAFFAVSPEFKQRYGTLTNRQFVERIYQNILGRPGEPSGVAFWTGELDSRRRARGWVMIGFSESPEYKRTSQPTVDLVHVYTGMLRRVPTQDERELWLQILSSGSDRTRVIAHLLSTTEYAERIPS